MSNFYTFRYKMVTLSALYSQWGDTNDPESDSPLPKAGPSRWQISSPRPDTCLRTRQTTFRDVCCSPPSRAGRVTGSSLKILLNLWQKFHLKCLLKTQGLRLIFQVLPFSASQGLQAPRYLTPWAAHTLQSGEELWRAEFQKHYWNVRFSREFFRFFFSL